MAGLLGIPGLDGFMAQRQMAGQEQNQQLQQAQGLLSMQQAMQGQQEMQKKAQLRGLLGEAIQSGDQQKVMGLMAQIAPESMAQNFMPKAQKWTPAEITGQDGQKRKGYVDINSPTPESTFRELGVEPVKPEFINGVPINPYTQKAPVNDPNKPFGYGADGAVVPNAPFQNFQMNRARAGASQNVTNVNMPGDNKYIDTRRAAQATALADLEKSAQSAYNQYNTLDRFIKASEKGFAGGAAPVLAGVSNFLSSFGYSSEALKDTRVMEQAIGDILGNKMAELGARGLTDKDMQILRDALPRVETDKKSRVEIAKIIKKANANTLKEYDTARAEEARIYPQLADRSPISSWYRDYKSNPQRFGVAPVAATSAPAGVDPKVWSVMTPEEQALWRQ